MSYNQSYEAGIWIIDTFSFFLSFLPPSLPPSLPPFFLSISLFLGLYLLTLSCSSKMFRFCDEVLIFQWHCMKLAGPTGDTLLNHNNR